MKHIYNNILTAINRKEKLLAVLIDPDKCELSTLPDFMEQLNASMTTHIFVGGSEVGLAATHILVNDLRSLSKLPILLFPGDITQITESADALLFLSLISGRNPEYLIGKHVEAASILKDSNLEIIPTGYVLIENGKETSVQKVTHTIPMKREDLKKVVDTVLAGQLLGQKLMYLEAGSGASHPVDPGMIHEVKKVLDIPLIVGGGIRTRKQLDTAYEAGADLIVVGTAFEIDQSFFDQLS